MAALVVCEAATGRLHVAALTLLDRLVVAVHRTGCAPIRIVCPGELPALQRARALGVTFEVLRDTPPIAGPTLVASTDLLVQASDVKMLVQSGGRLVSATGETLPAGIVSDWGASLEVSLNGLPPVRASGVSLPVRDMAQARAAERALWASLVSSSDGFVDKWFNRSAGRPLSKLLVHTAVTPNQVSLASIGIGVLAGVMFASGKHLTSIAAGILFQISAIVDCVDGDVARAIFKESPLGKWLDLIGDQVVHATVFAGIALGLSRSGQSGPFLWLGATAVLGGLIAFLVVVRGMARNGEPNRRLQKLIDGATSRDFSVLVLALACVNRLEWFLWLAAFGSHAFWVLALGLQLFPGKATDPAK